MNKSRQTRHDMFKIRLTHWLISIYVDRPWRWGSGWCALSILPTLSSSSSQTVWLTGPVVSKATLLSGWYYTCVFCVFSFMFDWWLFLESLHVPNLLLFRLEDILPKIRLFVIWHSLSTLLTPIPFLKVKNPIISLLFLLSPSSFLFLPITPLPHGASYRIPLIINSCTSNSPLCDKFVLIVPSFHHFTFLFFFTSNPLAVTPFSFPFLSFPFLSFPFLFRSFLMSSYRISLILLRIYRSSFSHFCTSCYLIFNF